MLNKKENWPKCSLVVDEFKTHSDLFENPNLLPRTVLSLQNVQSIQLIFTKEDDRIVRQNQLLSTLLTQVESAEQSNVNFEYVFVRDCPVHLLLLPAFVEYFVRTGHIHVQSVDCNIQDESAVTVGPDGVMHLSIDEQLYRSLGLVGVQSVQYGKQNVTSKRTIRIPLNSPEYKSFSSRMYQRTFTSLRNSELKFNLQIKWQPPIDCELSPDSLFKFFQLVKNDSTSDHNMGHFLHEPVDRERFQVQRCAPSVRRYLTYSAKFPCLPAWNAVESRAEQSEQEFADSEPYQLIELYSGILAGLDFESDEDLSSWPNLSKFEYKDFVCYELSGMFNAQNVSDALDELKRLLDDSEESIANFVLIVNGFENAVVSWYESNCEHGKDLSGECFFGVCVHKNDYSLVWRQADSLSFGIEKL